MTNNEKERLLCYAAGIVGSTISNPNHHSGVPDWLIERSIRQAHKLINSVFDDDELKRILENEHVSGPNDSGGSGT